MQQPLLLPIRCSASIVSMSGSGAKPSSRDGSQRAAIEAKHPNHAARERGATSKDSMKKMLSRSGSPNTSITAYSYSDPGISQNYLSAMRRSAKIRKFSSSSTLPIKRSP